MTRSVLLSVAAFIGGGIISFVNYRIMLLSAKSSSEKSVLAVSPLRSILSAAYLFALFFLGSKLKANTTALLIGGALGLTVSLVIFTKLLLNANNNGNTKDTNITESKEDNQ